MSESNQTINKIDSVVDGHMQELERGLGKMSAVAALGLEMRATALELGISNPGVAFDLYQLAALRTAPVEKGENGLLDVGAYNLWEAGEIGNIIKKVLHHGHDLDSVDKDDKKGRTYRQRIVDESGDLLWALAIILYAVGSKMSGAAGGNVEKLKKRYPAGFSIEASINRTE